MTKTTTPFLNALLNSKTEVNTSTICLDKDATLFYTLLKPKLNTLVKMPSQKSIDNILAFSKSL